MTAFHPFTWVASALAVVVTYAYLNSTKEAPADFRYVNSSGIHTLDPARMSWTQDFRVALNIWEGLTTSDPRTTKPQAGAAIFPPLVSADQLTYIFTIREDARWSNGDPVLAGDFIRGWRRCMEPGTGTDYTFLFTDNLAGAADYVSWRRKAAGALTTLDRLRQGWEIDAQAAQSLAHHPVFEVIKPSLSLRSTIIDQHDNHSASLGLARQLNTSNLNWQALYQQTFDQHVAQMDQRFSNVGLEATDDKTLLVRLLRPCPYFLDLTSFPSFLPCHPSVELLREGDVDSGLTREGLVVYDPQWTKPRGIRNGYPGLITNGPYFVSDWKFKQRLRMSANPFHRMFDTLNVRTIDMLVYENTSVAIMAYEAGEVDFLPGMDVPYDHELARLSQTGQRRDFLMCDTFSTYFMSFNCKDERIEDRPNPFIDARVRKAFALAVDKEAIVHAVLQRGDRVATTFIPPGALTGYPSPVGSQMDIAAAKQLLIEAGYPQGQGLPTVTLLYVPSDERVCQALAGMWETHLGARVELRCQETKSFAESKANHRFMIARGNWYGDYYDPTTFLDCFNTGNGNNDSGYSNTAYDALLHRARVTTDIAQRLELLAQAERIIVEDDLPIIPLLHYASPIAVKPNVSGIFPNPRLRFPFRYVSVAR